MSRLVLALALLCTPAHAGKTDMAKQPACVPGVMVVQAEPDLLVIGQPVNRWCHGGDFNSGL